MNTTNLWPKCLNESSVFRSGDGAESPDLLVEKFNVNQSFNI